MFFSIFKNSLLCLLLSLSSYVYSIEFNDDFRVIYNNIAQENWSISKADLLKHDDASLEVNFLWGLWYGNKNNPEYDKVKSTHYLETSYKLGSRDAQLLLIGRYLFSADSESVNYHAGMKLGADMLTHYQEKIFSGKDSDGELHRIVGKFYMLGIGVEKEIDVGLNYIKKAADLGDVEAKKILAMNNQ